MSPKPAARRLRGYQAEAVAAIVAGLEGRGSGQLRAACGTGKTYIASVVAAELAGGGVTVVLVPSIALAAQTIADWRAGDAAGRVLAVCSDSTVGGGGVRAGDLPVPVSTDAEVIAKWLVGAPAGALVVGTYDSAGRVAAGLRRAGIVADLTVFDEAHRLAGASGKVTAAVLAPGVLPDRGRLFMTATPRICTGTSPGGSLRTISMDDEEVFGPVVYRYPFRRAIRDGWLKDYRIVIATVTSRQVAGLLEGNSELTGEGDVPVKMAVAQEPAPHPAHHRRPGPGTTRTPRRARGHRPPRPKTRPLTTPQASRHTTDRIVAPAYRASDAGLRPGPFPGRAASLLPGLLAATRTGLSPAGDDELTNTKIHHGTTSRCHLPFCWAHETSRLASNLFEELLAGKLLIVCQDRSTNDDALDDFVVAQKGKAGKGMLVFLICWRRVIER
jgi:hypothetical protein